ncbi:MULTISPECIES: LysR substrate-binding domain-containing protein [unclassified Rhizobium]|uniref:LysR substrate-binding domain-containing protein n=1 Tax=unclassified Rhizobium TaxID=2613769 RepID=UPI002479AD8B|nr:MULTISPECIES: LysR substrate-binding domain-containing protein [unclassified Rhizobium]MDH7804561.1 LysR family glycine cleavage system transcriptional activator [Rhizobium sp. AN70]
MSRLPPLNWLRAFEAAGRLSSFSKAADELCVTHSAVSQQIKKLEDWCGVGLFHRDGSGVQVTNRGGALFRELTRDLERIADIFDTLRMRATPNQLRIAVIPSVATRLLIPKIADFKEANPQISLSISYAVARDGIDLSDLDILITYLDGPYEGPYSATKLLAGEVRPVCAPSYLRCAPRTGDDMDFSLATLLHDEDRNAWSRWLQKCGITPKSLNSSTVFADFNLLSIAAIAGHGVALCPTSLISAELERGDLVQLSDVPENCDRNYLLFQHRRKTDEADRFCSWISGVLPDSQM